MLRRPLPGGRRHHHGAPPLPARGLEAQGHRLIANGGSYQEVPMLHFHLISDVKD
jgi:hypothetical protein